MALIDRYLAKAIFVPLVGTLLLAAMLLVLDKMLRLFDFVVSEGGPVSIVWQMLANMLPEYFALGIPIGLLIGILLAFRKLALSSELDALRGIGVGYGRMLRVPYAYALVLLLLNLFIVGWVDPYARYNYEGLRFDLRSGALGASIKVGEFNRLGDDIVLRIDRSEDEGEDLQGIFVASNAEDMQISATAANGRFLATDDPETIIFRLERGRLIQEDPDFSSPRTLAFESYDLPVNLPNVGAFRARGLDEIKELYLPELIRLAYAIPQASAERQWAARANLHFRLVEALMMLMLPMLAIALAVPSKRSSSSLGIFVAIVMVVTYHKINQYAEGAGAQGRLNPEAAMYAPFLAFSALIGWMYHVIAYRVGGQPIGALEAFFAKIGKAVRRLFPDPARRARKRREAALAAGPGAL